MGVVMLALLLRSTPWRGRAIATILVACWLWVMWFYLLQYYDPINWAARYFAVGFAIEASLLFWTGIVRDGLRFDPRSGLAQATGLGFVGFALAVHPLVGPLLIDRPWRQVEIFGAAPDPTVLATLGVLLADERPQWYLLVLPVIWCAISGATLWTMQSPEAPVMPAVAAMVLALTARKALARPQAAGPGRS
jgi:Family of unknown function (DUF6064)